MLPERYKKVVVRQLGTNPHECLEVVDVPFKKLHPHDVLVKNHYAGLNSTDVRDMIGLGERHQPLPFSFGVEAIGEIVAVGDKVEEYHPGDTVVTALPGNGYSEYSIVDRNFTGRIPAIDPRYSGIFISGSIAKIALEYVADIQNRETVMVTSGLSSSGHFAVQIAKNQGCHVVTTCSTQEEAEILKELGADRVIHRGQEDVAGVLADEYHHMLNVVFDNLGGAVLDACIAHTAPRARVLLLEALREHLRGEKAIHSINLFQKLILRSVALIGFNPGDYANAIPMESIKLLDQLQTGLIQSIVDPVKFEGIESVPDAIAHLMSGTSRGKIVVKL